MTTYFTKFLLTEAKHVVKEKSKLFKLPVYQHKIYDLFLLYFPTSPMVKLTYTEHLVSKLNNAKQKSTSQSEL